MLLRMIYDDKLAQAAWLIGCQRTGEALIVDPERDIDRYLDLAEREGLRVTAVAETHIHADFLSGARELAERTGAKLYLSDEGDADWKYGWLDQKRGGGTYAHQLLHDGDRFRVGGIEVQALHTPGHTPEHLAFLVTDRGGGADAPIGLASGDFVFVGDLGRPDLLESAAGHKGAAAPSAHRLYRSVQRLLDLPDYVQIWPAHGAGSSCGKALGAVPQSTVGYERRFNAAIQAASSEDGFVEFILAGQPEPPLYFARMKRDNKEGPPLLGELPRPRALDGEAAAVLDGQAVAILDTRPWEAFRAGHLAGALHAPLERTFTETAGSFVREDEAIVLVVEAGRVEEAVRDLVRIGLDRVEAFIEPGVLADPPLAARLVESREVSAEEALRALAAGAAYAIDVRRKAEVEAGALPDHVHLPLARLADRTDQAPRDRPPLVYCRSGKRSAIATAWLERSGLAATNVKGGWLALKEASARADTAVGAATGAAASA